MQKFLAIAVTVLGLCLPGLASATPIATATLSGYIQHGAVTNSASATANITQVVYSLGSAGDGIATWEVSGSGGIASDFLSDGKHFQTISFLGLSIAPGATFNFGGLDIDLIETLSPLSVTGGILDTVGTSLANAFMTLVYSDGSSATTSLAQQGWTTPQNLEFNITSQNVPVPGALGLLGLGLLVIGLRRRYA